MPIVPAIRACRCIGAYLLDLLDGHLGPIRCSDPVATDAWWSDGAQALHGPREPFERTEGGRPVALVGMLGCCVRLSRARSDRRPRPRSTAAICRPLTQSEGARSACPVRTHPPGSDRGLVVVRWLIGVCRSCPARQPTVRGETAHRREP